jgi:dipeptidyl aminopeptidase/acylaminoacyl peptidase
MQAPRTASGEHRTHLRTDVMRRGVAVLTTGLLACCTSPDVGAAAIERDARSAAEAEPSPPEGTILLSMGARLFPTGARTDASPGLVGEAISPDGATVVAMTEVRLPTGISYNSDLVLIDARTREETLLARTDAREEFGGPMEWSPDGTRIAYNFVRYRTNPAVIFPGPRPELQTVCIISVGAGSPTCYPDLGTVFDFDWSPDGRSLAVTGPRPEPLQLVDVATGRRTTLMTLDDPGLRRVLAGRVVQLNSPAWSPSGRYVAAWAEVIPGGSVPVIFGRDGRIVARGLGVGLDPRKLMWIPGRDLLLYTPGVTNEHVGFLKLFEVDPATSKDRLFLKQRVHPQITDVALSPTGRWLALLRWKSYANMVIEFVDVSSSEHVRGIRLLEETSLADWGPEARR